MKLAEKLFSCVLLTVIIIQTIAPSYPIIQLVQVCKDVPSSVLTDIEHPLVTIVIKNKDGITSVAEFEKCNTELPDPQHVSNRSRHTLLNNAKLKFNFKDADDVNTISLYEGSVRSNHQSRETPEQLGFRAAITRGDPERFAEITDFKPKKTPIATKEVRPNEVPKGTKIKITRDNQIVIKAPKPKLGSIAVYKTKDDGKKWDIRSMDTDKNVNPSMFGKTSIKRDTTGLNTRKLKYPKDRQWWVWVNIPGYSAAQVSPMSGTIEKDSIIIIDELGKAQLGKEANKPIYDKK